MNDLWKKLFRNAVKGFHI